MVSDWRKLRSNRVSSEETVWKMQSFCDRPECKLYLCFSKIHVWLACCGLPRVQVWGLCTYCLSGLDVGNYPSDDALQGSSRLALGERRGKILTVVLTFSQVRVNGYLQVGTDASVQRVPVGTPAGLTLRVHSGNTKAP